MDLCHLSKSSSADYQRGVQQDIKYNGLVKNAYLTYLSSRYIVERPRFSCLAAAVGERPDSINFSAELSFSLSKVSLASYNDPPLGQVK